MLANLFADGAPLTPDNARFISAPIPVVLHIVSASIYTLLGALQFAPGFRRRRPDWHRAAGRVLVVAGLVATLSGLWMAMFYAIIPADSALLHAFRLFFGSAMVCHLTRPEVDALLAAPDQQTWSGRRDHALLLLAVQTGLRLSELTSLRTDDVSFGTGAHVHVLGKGRVR